MTSEMPRRPRGRPPMLPSLTVALCLTLLLGSAAWLGSSSAARTPAAGADALPLAIRAEARTLDYVYDDAGRLKSVDYGDGSAITYTYDAGGNLLARDVVVVAPPQTTPTSGPPQGRTLYLPYLHGNQ